jgi:hypothetical protein
VHQRCKKTRWAPKRPQPDSSSPCRSFLRRRGYNGGVNLRFADLSNVISVTELRRQATGRVELQHGLFRRMLFPPRGCCSFRASASLGRREPSRNWRIRLHVRTYQWQLDSLNRSDEHSPQGHYVSRGHTHLTRRSACRMSKQSQQVAKDERRPGARIKRTGLFVNLVFVLESSTISIFASRCKKMSYKPQ